MEYAGALYHVTSRGEGQEDIYEEDTDRRLFLSVLGDVCLSYNWVCHAYCLMSNHYHLVIETPDANLLSKGMRQLTKGMRQLNGEYTRQFNKAHRRVGHVFQGRYKGIHFEKEWYLLELSRYVVLNPVRAFMVKDAIDWPWSNYRAIIGYEQAPSWLHSEWILSAFGSQKTKAIEAYKHFVSAGRGHPSL
ncbi:MAG: putative transposase [Arenicella sp.]|jgi:putative transposase